MVKPRSPSESLSASDLKSCLQSAMDPHTQNGGGGGEPAISSKTGRRRSSFFFGTERKHSGRSIFGRKESVSNAGSTPRKGSTVTTAELSGLSDQQLVEIREAFAIFDTDGDGIISHKEFARALECLGSPLNGKEAEAALREMDSDNNGYVEFVEFLECIANKLQDPVSEQEIVQSFAIFDKDGNGKISADEFREIMMSLGDKLEESEVEEMLNAADTNKDGVIDYSEFAKLLTGNLPTTK